jgi:Cu/Zn superoxide dismutase
MSNPTPAGGEGGSAPAPSEGDAGASSLAGSNAGGEGNEGGSAGTENTGGVQNSGGAGAGGAPQALGGGGSGGADATGGVGGAPVAPDGVAVAQLATTGVDGAHDDITGTATFTQVGDEVTLLLELQGCPMGPHISHIHVNPSCDDEGNGAGNHWLPSGELITDYSCDAEGNASYMLVIDGGTWTVGSGDDETDVDGHSFVVHNGTQASPGDRVACGVIEQQE